MIAFGTPGGYALLNPNRTCDIVVEVAGPLDFARAAGFSFSGPAPSGPVGELILFRSDAIPSRSTCDWWRHQVREVLGPDFLDDDADAAWPWELLPHDFFDE